MRRIMVRMRRLRSMKIEDEDEDENVGADMCRQGFTWAVESRSRTVTVWSSRLVRSTVTPNGTPISSVRAYRFPIVFPAETSHYRSDNDP